MIIVRLEGGLGNSMFQYALARHLSLKTGAPLQFDISSFKTNALADCSFWLEKLNIDVQNNLASPYDVSRLRRRRTRPKWYWRWYNALVSDNTVYVREPGFEFHPEILSLTGPDLYLHGNWQTEKYFSDIRNVLLSDFKLREPLQGKNAEVAAQMASSNSIAMQIRRKDYVTNPKVRRLFGELSKKYFDAALTHITSRVENPVLYIFCDDIPWVREHFSFPVPTTYMDWNGEDKTGATNMYLASHCKHAILANSSYGWWGAWLSQHADKIVVAPETWFKDFPKMNTKDIVPDSWIKIPSYFVD